MGHLASTLQPPLAMSTTDIQLYAGAVVALFCSYKAVKFLLHPYYFSNLRNIPGPKNRNVLKGHIPELDDNEETVFFDKQFEEKGPVIKIFGLLQVRRYISLFSAGEVFLTGICE